MLNINKQAKSHWDKIFQWWQKPENFALLDEPSQYAYDVAVNRSYVVSEMIWAACARHLLFLYYYHTKKPDFNFKYNPRTFQLIQNFAKNIIVPEINKPFIFPAFRKFICSAVFGWEYDPDKFPHKTAQERELLKGKLITTEIFDVEARKQWKSSFWSMIMLCVSLGLLKDGKPEIYISGPQKDTSKIPYDIALNYIFKSPKLQPFFEKFNSIHIKSKKLRGIIKHLSFEKSAIEGKNPSLVILTEYHLHQNDTMQESAISSRNMSRKNQLIVYDTTKGHNINSVCHLREKQYKKILIEQIENPFEIHKNFDIFLWAAELDIEDYENWTNKELWAKANPGLNVSVSMEHLESEFNKIDSNASEVEFKIKRLGMWVGAANAYFSLQQIIDSNNATKAAVQPYIDNNFKDLTAILGVDLSTNIDTTSICLNFEIDDGTDEKIWVFKCLGFIPETTAQNHIIKDRVPYFDWKQGGFMDFTPGSVVDHNYLSDIIKEWKDNYNIKRVAYDNWHFLILEEFLLKKYIFYKDDFQAVKNGTYLTPIFKVFERKLLLNKIHFLDNEMVIDHLTNLEVKNRKGDTSGNVTLHKINENQRIDSVMAMLYAATPRISISGKNEAKTFTLISD